LTREEFIGNLNKKEKAYFQDLITKATARGYKVHVKIVEYLENAYASVEINDLNVIVRILDSKARENYHLIHELKHFEFNMRYPRSVRPKKYSEKYVMVLATLLNNLHHHLLLEDEIDKEFNYDRTKNLIKFDSNFQESTKKYITGLLNNLNNKLSFIQYLSIVIDSKIRRINYEDIIKYHVTPIKEIDKLADEIVRLRTSLDLENESQTENFFNQAIKIIQKESNRIFKENVIFMRKLQIC